MGLRLPPTGALIFALAILLLPVCAFTQTPRLALVVGNNRGNNPSKALRFAERDAERFAEILRSVGGFDAADVQLLKGPGKADFKNSLHTLKNRIRERSQQGAVKTLALIYYSGHADGVHLELGSERISFSEVKAATESIGADVKILIVDSCQSGGITSYKGGHRGPSFDLVLTDTIDANGTAVLTSSAAGEKSQESGRLKGSFFTHFLVSGLSGAADFDQDRQVTLNEIYQYTYKKTVAETARTMGGTQHPTYDFRITGRGKVVIADLTRGGAALLFSSRMQGSYLIIDARTDEIVAEITKPADVPRRAALAPGDYRIAFFRDDAAYATELTLAYGEEARLTNASFAPEPALDHIFDKGSETEPASRGIGVSAYYGMLSGALKRYSVLHEGIIALRLDLKRISLFPRFTVGATSIDEEGFRYELLLLTGEGAAAWRFERAALDLFLGINLGGGYGRQQLSDELRTGSIFIYGLLTGLEYLFSRHFLLSIFWEVGSHVYRAENDVTQSLLLRGSIGAGVRF